MGVNRSKIRFLRLGIFAAVTTLCTFLPLGYQMVIVNVPQMVLQTFVNQSIYQRYNMLTTDRTLAGVWSIVVACQGIGCVVASMFATIPAERLGRKWSVMGLIPACYLAGSAVQIMSCPCDSFELIMLGRLLIGFGTGLTFAIVPVYLLECTPVSYRGMVGSLTFLAVLIGDAFARLIGGAITSENFSYGLGATAIPAAIFLALSPFFPESPKFLLLKRKDEVAAKHAIAFYFGDGHQTTTRLAKIRSEEDKAGTISFRAAVRLQVYRVPMLLSMASNAAAAAAGLFACFTYSSMIFASLGIDKPIAKRISMSMLASNLLCGILQVFLVHRTSRRMLILSGAALIIGLHLALFTASQLVQHLNIPAFGYLGAACLVLIMITVILTIASTSIFLPPEISLQSGRSLSATAGGVTRSFGMLITQLAFPNVLQMLGNFAYLLFAGFLVLFAAYLYRELPETRGKRLDEITAKWSQKDDTLKAKAVERCCVDNTCDVGA